MGQDRLFRQFSSSSSQCTVRSFLLLSTLSSIVLLHIVVSSRLHLSTSLVKETHQSHLMRVLRPMSFHRNNQFGHFIVFLFRGGLAAKVFLCFSACSPICLVSSLKSFCLLRSRPCDFCPNREKQSCHPLSLVVVRG